MLSYWVLLFPCFSNCEDSEYPARVITHDEKHLETVTHEQNLNGKKIKTWVYKLIESQSHPYYEMCHDEIYHLIYVFSSKIHTNDTSDISVYLIELQNHHVSLLLHLNREFKAALRHQYARLEYYYLHILDNQEYGQDFTTI
ncbi:hypothetical protein RF11_01795 [Thelohanellus kitauei]|uniref:Uncharacterized protein n=1 Tax=Thelohanellus kitauei TaxID=669202 RepID=A0A0C2JXE9_THEKT|nr:hypothetical protein RF11_01795 [Thelohanellus kitauei]